MRVFGLILLLVLGCEAPYTSEQLRAVRDGYLFVGPGTFTGIPAEMMAQIAFNTSKCASLNSCPLSSCIKCNDECIPKEYLCCGAGWCRDTHLSCCRMGPTATLCCPLDDKDCCSRWTFNKEPRHKEL